MSPLQKAAARLRGRGAQDDEAAAAQQHGRSNTNLAAEQAARELRRERHSRSPAPSNPFSPPGSRGTTPTPTGARSPSSRSGPRASPPRPTPSQRNSTHAPAVSSPLNPSSPTASLASRDSTISSDDRDAASQTRPGGPETGQFLRSQSTNALTTNTSASTDQSRSGASMPWRGRGPFSDIHQVRKQQSTPSLRHESPLTVHDLGRDYSRYPVPSSRHSYVDGSSGSSPSSHRGRVGAAAAGAGAGAAAASLQNSPNPFDSSSNLIDNADPEKSFSPFIDDRISAPGPYMAGLKFPVFIDEKEFDDDMHMPQDDDDLKFKATWKDYIHKDGIIAVLSLMVMVIALLSIFVVLPVLTFTGHAEVGPVNGPKNKPDPADHVNDKKYPLFENVRRTLIDPDTPKSAMTRKSTSGETLNLVFSDEFNQDGRTFYPEDDPYWTAPDIWYGATQDLEWYDPDASSTQDGTLNLQLDKFFNHNINYRSGMLNSWNQICFQGGALEVSLSLPKPAGSPGLWPGVWTMGNLGRPGYMASTEGVWPFTYSSCDVGITHNQSSPDGISYQPGQKLSSCSCPGEDHPSPGTGRGAPEIDVIEASVDPGNRIGVVTQSFQVAPYDIWYHPDYRFLSVPNEATTQMNSYCGGPYQQAISGTTLLNNDWYGEKQYQKYAFEYVPGYDDGRIAWFVGDDVSYEMHGAAVGPNGNVGAREISQEPMSIVLNLGISEAWTWIDWTNLTFPTAMNIDYVRWYQRDGYESVTCDPPGYETTDYIKNHPIAYSNPNMTHWNQTGYPWPKNTLTGCD